MNKQLYLLLIAQFLSAFADNAILFTVIAMVLKSTQLATWYVPALQSVFLIAFVVLAPWVGGFADRYAKSRILIIGNLIKAVGAGLLLLNIEPLIAYAVVGTGAAVYSPAKYGILPELAGHALLVKANSWIEGSTILAILLGMLLGAMVADYSINLALTGVIILFIISALVTLLLPTYSANKGYLGSQLILFRQQISQFFDTTRSRFAILGAAIFWATAATLRVIIIAWAPLVLMSKNASEISEVTLFLAIGIIVGSALVPKLISLEKLALVRFPAYLMAVFIIALSFTSEIWSARAILFIIGTAGGMFIVPINAALQELGQQSIGSGVAVAMQGFFQNVAMLLAIGLYTLSTWQDISPVSAMLCLGAVLLFAALMISMRLPKHLNDTNPE